MATEREKTKIKNDELTKALNEIINQNLSTGTSTLSPGDDTYDFNDDHVDVKSNASGNWRRGSVSYSQPSSPKGNPSLSPVSSVSSLSDLSTTETYDDDSESCASLNSVNSTFSNGIIREFEFNEIIHENKVNFSPLPTDKKVNKNNKKRKKKNKNKKIKKQITFKTNRTKKSRVRRNSKDCLDITTISRLTAKSIELWSINEVIQWIKYIDNGKYKEYAIKFKSKKIDGRKLYKMNRTMLQSIEVYHPSARKAILAALQRLKAKVRQTSKKQINLYAKTHRYQKKKEKKIKHKRGVSMKLNTEMYVVAVKKTASQRKYSENISEFLELWNIKQTENNNINFIGSNILEQTDNFTMIELANKRIVYAVTAKVEKWTNHDVCKWLNSISSSRFKKFISKFKQRNTNGFDLLNISRVQLKNNINMRDAEMRNILLREIKLLKVATQATSLNKKRASAISIKDIQASQKRKSKHVKSSSVSSMNMIRAQSQNDLWDPIQKKLGPREIGRNRNYKGTKYEKSMFNYNFLEEKLNYKAKNEQFQKRKRKNPVQHKKTVTEIGIFKDFEKPKYYDILRQNNGGWLKDKPISRRNVYLDSLKGTKISKASPISDIQSPVGWKPIEYKYKHDGKAFLEEHFWFDGSGVKFEFGFSRLLNCLSPNKLIQLNKQPSPTGYESKLNWLKMLLKMVTQEMQIIRKEDALYAQDIVYTFEDNSEHKSDEKSGDKFEDKSENIPENKIENKSDDTSENKSEMETKSEDIVEDLSLPNSLLVESDKDSDSDKYSDSDSNNELSPSMDIKRAMYKLNRTRANTTLANSTLSGVSPMTPRTIQRMLSREDVNRRRFISQESVDSIQAIISGIEKKRANGNEVNQ